VERTARLPVRNAGHTTGFGMLIPIPAFVLNA